MNMRLRISKLLTFLIIAINLFLIYYTWKLFIVNSFGGKSATSTADTNNKGSAIIANSAVVQSTDQSSKPKDKIQSTNKHIKKAITIVFRDFYHFENDLKASIDSIVALIPNIQIIIVYDEEPYPPMEYLSNFTLKNNLKFINMKFDVRKSLNLMMPIFQIKTKYVLLLPDSVRLGGRSILQKMLKIIGNTYSGKNNNIGAENKIDNNKIKEIDSSNNNKVNSHQINNKQQKKMLVIPFSSNIRGYSNCCKIKTDLPNWTLEYSVQNGSDNCDMFLQKHAILIETSILKEMPDALVGPFPEMFYIEAKIWKIKKLYLSASLQDGKRLFTASHNKQRKKEIRRQQFKEMYRKLQVKKVIRKVATKLPRNRNDGAGVIKQQQNRHRDGGKMVLDNAHNFVLANYSSSLVTTTEFYGCEKNTKSCIGTIYNSKPFYVYLDKHTPPCCVEKLKSVFNHIIEEFDNVGIRYWLDNQALKSAIDINGLSADAYEIDISFNLFDLERSSFLKKCQTRPLTDASGFYWIKATDGHYFRVQYSKINQIGVNLLPFDINGDRIVPNGFYGWKAKEFSSEFLHPMSTVFFLGKNVMCPNNVKEFLDLKELK